MASDIVAIELWACVLTELKAAGFRTAQLRQRGTELQLAVTQDIRSGEMPTLWLILDRFRVMKQPCSVYWALVTADLAGVPHELWTIDLTKLEDADEG